MSQGQLTLVDNVCSRCGQAAPRYRPRSTHCRQCTIAAAIERNKAKGKDYLSAAVRRCRARKDPEQLRAHRQQERARGAALIGRSYKTKEQQQLDRKAKAEAMAESKAMRLLMRESSRSGAPAGLSQAEYARWRTANDPQFTINQRMRTATKKALRGAKAGRRWEELVGYTVADLMAHFERQMPRGYSMADFGNGKLHIDHIIPKSMFDVTKPDELRACWALSNLRPLPAKANMRKGAKRVTLL